jgi:hypothetical protein
MRGLTIISDPLIIPSDLLHHSILQVCRLDALVLDKVLDLSKGHDTIRISAFSLLARSGKATSEGIAALILDRITTTVHGETKVDLLRVQAVEPERNSIVTDLADIGLATNDLAESPNIGVPGTMKV